jgi:chromosome segregation ATPase
VAAIYEKYKIYIIIGVVCFALGYCLALLSSRGQLSALRVRADQATADYREARQAQQSAIKRVGNLQNELNAATKRIGELQSRLDAATKSASSIASGIDASKKLSNDSGELIKESRRILQTVRKRGQNKD